MRESKTVNNRFGEKTNKQIWILSQSDKDKYFMVSFTCGI